MFAPDDSLADVVHFLGATLPGSEALESHSWEEIVEATGSHGPFWW